MANVTNDDCRDCRESLYSAINKRVPWVVFAVFVLLLGSAIGFAVVRATDSSRRSDVGEIRTDAMHSAERIRALEARQEMILHNVEETQADVKEILKAVKR